MSWHQARIRINKQDLEAVEDKLLELGALSITLEDQQDDPIFEPKPGELPLWDNIELTALFSEQTDTSLVHALIAQQYPDINAQFEFVADQDWQRAWMDRFEPMQFGDNIWICPSWRDAPVANACNILLDPGLAFGTGAHPTTAMCLAWLDQADVKDKVVIDYGCGSGILAIAAALLGAKHVYAIDIDPQAVTASNDNAQKNNCSDKITAILSSDESKHELQNKADIIIANILAGPLCELAEHFNSLARESREFCLSGVLHEQQSELEQTYSKHIKVSAIEREGDWIMLAGKR